jgi:cyclophilin family peptidyl-prolyl cis-trans isomerase
MNKIFAIIISLVVVIFLISLIPNNKPENKTDFKSNISNNEIENNKNTQNMSTEKVTTILNTNMGPITLELDPTEAPKTVENFVSLAKSGFYNGTKFHRVIKDFMIQGGDPISKDDSQKDFWGTGGPGYTFEDEVNGIELVAGVIAMANSGPDTNGSQFFIITANATPWLQGKHTGFGFVTEGMDIVMKIQDTETEGPDRPVEDVVIESVEIK